MRARIATVLATALLACSAERASAPKATPSLRIVDRHPSLAIAPLGAFHVATRALQVTHASRGDAPVRIADDEQRFLEIADRDAPALAPAHEGDRRVFAGGSAGASIVHQASATRFEDLHVFERAVDRVRVRYRVRLGGDLALLRVTDGRLEAVSPDGQVRLQSDPLRLEDDRGVSRPLVVSLRAIGAGEYDLALDADTHDLAFPVVVDPAWTTSPAALKSPRASAALVPMGGATAMIYGGTGLVGESLSTAEWFDGTSWASRPDAPLAAFDPSGARLADGRVLFGVSSNAMTYQPSTSTWSAPLATGIVVGVRAFTVSDGALLVGSGGTAYKFVAATSTMTTAGTVLDSWYGWAQLTDGRIVANNSSLHSLWNGTSWAPFGAFCSDYDGQYNMGASALDDHRVLLSGGQDAKNVVLSGAAIVDVVAKTFVKTGNMLQARAGHVSVRLPSGRVLVVGGADQTGAPIKSAEVYDPATATWSSAGSLAIARRDASGALLLDGRVMVAGGIGASGLLTSVELYSPLANGTACTGGGECASGFCTDGVCCNAACTGACSTCSAAGSVGTCTARTGAPRTATSCAPYASCSAGACATTCTGDGQCASTHYCTGGACTPKRDYGKTCTAANQCASGACVDGYCCTSSCTAQCGACDVPGKEGVCWPARGKPHGARAACSGAADPECGSQCNGTDASKCNVPSAATSCGVASCASGVEHHVALCNGSGACADTAKSCGAYACGDTACKTSCSARTDCAPGFGCKAGSCVPVESLGKPCDGDMCATGLFCTDGVCCGEATCEAGSKCIALAGGGAGCRKSNGTTCGADAECGSAHCADGVCCDSACTDQCVACDVADKVGTCSLVDGAPHGARPACDKGADVCGARSCGGDAKSCTTFVGATTECGAASCEDGVAQAAATCDGKGACTPATKAPCGAYVCDAVTRGCRTTCSGNSDCATGHVCAAGKCERPLGICSADGAEVQASDGSKTACAPFLCVDGRCATSCETSATCAVGFLCDAAQRTCVPLPTGEGDQGGGCSTSSRASNGASGAWMFGALAIVVALRRRAVALALGAAAAGCSSDPPTEVAQTRAALWTSAGSMSTFRTHPRATKLPSGKVFIVGANGTSNSELFDPTTSTWSLGPTMSVLRRVPTLAWSSGKVLVMGVDMSSDFTEWYDPVTSTFSVGPKLVEKLFQPDAVSFSTGHVLVNAGIGSEDDELYDPSTGAFSLVPAPKNLSASVFALLPSNRVLYAGGYTGSGYADDAYIFTLSTKTWATTTKLPQVRAYAASIPLASNSVLVTGGVVKLGGLATAVTPTTLLFDPATSTWTARAPMLSGRSHHAILRLASGRVFVSGGSMGAGPSGYEAPTSTAEIYDPVSDRWFSAGAMKDIRIDHAMTALDDGRILVAGGGPGTSEVFSFRALGEPCTVAGECDSLACVDGVCCNTQSCAAGSACNLPTTTGRCAKDNGQTCAASTDCGSGFCVDGVCCNAACGGLCEACDDPTSKGTCVPVSGPTRGTRAPCPAGSDVCSITRCDGVDRVACHYAAAGTVACGANTCAAGVETHASTCDGSGKCGGAPSSCGSYVCGATACVTSCTTEAQCAPGSACKSGTCVPRVGLGLACGATKECTDGLSCVDGVCCGSSSCESGARCNGAGNLGRCAKNDGGACSVDAECASGSCVDGLCCDSKCGGICEACNVAGLEGKCTAVVGAPAKGRPSCPSDGGCGAHVCDGKDRASCAAFAGAEVACRTAACAGGAAIKAAHCDGSGACPAPETIDCMGFACDAASAGCKSSCSSNADCAEDYECSGGACKSKVAVCSDDGLAVVLVSGRQNRCYPLRCEAGACIDRCSTTTQCASGFVCDSSSGQCVAPEAAAAEGGCAMSGHGAGTSAALLLLAALARTRRSSRRR